MKKELILREKSDHVPSKDILEDGSPEEIRRHFLKRFGKYAVSAPVVTFTLMSAMSSKAIASGGNEEGGGGFS